MPMFDDPSQEDERIRVPASASAPIPLTAPIQSEPEPTAKPVTVEEWAARKGTPDWLFAAVKQLHHWAIGAELTEEQFDDAVKAMHAQQFGGGL